MILVFFIILCYIFFMETIDKKTLKIKIENVNINGEGISNIDDKKICVKYVLPGEEVITENIFTKKNFIKGKLEEIIIKSEKRINPICPYYQKCGGCDLQHINYDNSVQLKKEIIANYFSELYCEDIQVVKSNNSFNYRNKASFVVINSNIGFQEEGTNKLVGLNKCVILDDAINNVLKLFKNWLKENQIKYLNHIVVRVLNKHLLITLVVNKKPENLKILVNYLKQNLTNNFGLYLNYNSSKDKILSNNWEHVFGLKELQDSFEGVKFFVHPYSFLQINDDVRNKLYKKVLELVEDEIVIEGYSGVGLLTSIISKKAKKVFGVEINKNATQNANILIKENNILNVQNINGDCKIELPILAKKNPNATFIIDPPRSGCDNKVLQAIIDCNIQKVIYISCNPYTLKQNIKFLSDNYKVESLTIFDMFPQTFNCETLAILSKK